MDYLRSRNESASTRKSYLNLRKGNWVVKFSQNGFNQVDPDHAQEWLNGTAERLNGTAERLNGTAERLNGTAELLNGTTERLNRTAERLNG